MLPPAREPVKPPPGPPAARIAWHTAGDDPESADTDGGRLCYAGVARKP